MRLPNFTAEASLCTSARHYGMAVSPSVSEGASGVVTPQINRGVRTSCWDMRIQGGLVRCCQFGDEAPVCWLDGEGYPGRVV